MLPSRKQPLSLGRQAIGVGRGSATLGAGGGVSNYEVSFLAGLPTGFTLTRSTQGMYRDASGNWQIAAVDAPRLHHDTYGVVLGLAFEKAITRKLRVSENPTTLGGTSQWTPSAPAIGGVASDATALAGLDVPGLEDVVTSFISLDDTAGGSNVTSQALGTVGNLNPHAIRAILKQMGTGANCTVGLSGGGQVELTTDNIYEEILIEDITPGTTARLLQFGVKIGRILYVALADLTESRDAPLFMPRFSHQTGPYASGPESAVADLSVLTGYSASGCTIGFEWYHHMRFTAATEVMFAIVDESDEANTYLLVRGAADGSLVVTMYSGGVEIFTSTPGTPAHREVNRVAIRLEAGNYEVALNGVLGGIDSGSEGAIPSGFDKVRINRKGSDYGVGLARSIPHDPEPFDDAALAAASVVSSEGVI